MAPPTLPLGCECVVLVNIPLTHPKIKTVFGIFTIATDSHINYHLCEWGKVNVSEALRDQPVSTKAENPMAFFQIFQLTFIVPGQSCCPLCEHAEASFALL